MNTLARVSMFGLTSALVWSAVPGVLVDLFSTRSDIPAAVIAGIVAGMVTSAILASLLVRVGRAAAVLLGLLSLPLGAFLFGFALALIGRFIPALTSGPHALGEPWMLGINYALLSVISIFVIGLFPLAVFTTLPLRAFVVRGKTRAA